MCGDNITGTLIRNAENIDKFEEGKEAEDKDGGHWGPEKTTAREGSICTPESSGLLNRRAC